MNWLRVPIHGGAMVIDLKSWPLYVSRPWHVSDTGYAVSRDGKPKKTTRFHRLVAGTPDGMYTDHLNHVPLDNRDVNLRVVTQSENMRNLKDQGRGYWFHKMTGKWAVQVFRTRPGLYETEQEAAKVAQLIREGKPYPLPVYGRPDKETHCVNGHEYAMVGFYSNKEGHKLCRLCQSIRSKAYFKKVYIPRPRAQVTVCPRGHDKTITGTPHGDCRECAKIRAKKHKEVLGGRIS